MKFIVNNDLDRVVFNQHNLFHFFFSMLLAIVFDFQAAYAIGVVWEFGDGWKKNWKYAPQGKDIISTFRREFLFSDHFSLQDLLIHDLCGAAIGHILGRLIRIFMGIF